MNRKFNFVCLIPGVLTVLLGCPAWANPAPEIVRVTGGAKLITNAGTSTTRIKPDRTVRAEIVQAVQAALFAGPALAILGVSALAGCNAENSFSDIITMPGINYTLPKGSKVPAALEFRAVLRVTGYGSTSSKNQDGALADAVFSGYPACSTCDRGAEVIAKDSCSHYTFSGVATQLSPNGVSGTPPSNSQPGILHQTATFSWGGIQVPSASAPIGLLIDQSSSPDANCGAGQWTQYLHFLSRPKISFQLVADRLTDDVCNQFCQARSDDQCQNEHDVAACESSQMPACQNVCHIPGNRIVTKNITTDWPGYVVDGVDGVGTGFCPFGECNSRGFNVMTLIVDFEKTAL